MSVHYKFKSALEYDTVTFDGLHISVKDFKKAILQQKKIGKTSDFDLQVTNAQTKETYSDENVLIPKNASLIVARVPLSQQQRKQWEKEKLAAGSKLGETTEQNVLSQVDISSLDLSEEEKIKTMISQSTSDYDPSNYVKVRGGNQVGTVPASYICFKCHQHGHWIKDCPSTLDSSNMGMTDTIKKSTGIPRSFMIEVEGPQVPGARMTPSGAFAVPAIDHEVYKEKKIEKPPFLVEKEKPAPATTIPEDLICGICKDLLQDAVMIPCCGISFCDECIRNVLVDSEDSECPDCNEKNVSPDTMIPNRFLRNSVNTFKNKTGYVKVKPKLIQQRPPSPPRPSLPDFVPPPELQIDNSKQQISKSDADLKGDIKQLVLNGQDTSKDSITAENVLQNSSVKATDKENSKLEKLKKAGIDIDDVSSVSSNASEEPPPPVENRRLNEGQPAPSQGPSYAIPSLFSGQHPVILPPPGSETYPPTRPGDAFVHSCHDYSGSGGERSGTPTVDERLEVPPIRPTYDPYRPPSYMVPGYDQHYGMPHPMPMSYDSSMMYERGYRGIPRGPRMHRGRYAMRQPPPPGSRPLTPPRNEEEAYLAFQRMLKEKEERDKRKNEKLKLRRSTSRSRSRSATRSRRSFSGARSRSRTRSRTPPRRSRSRSKKRSRTRSRSFVMSRSRSRSYSRSPLHERNYSPKKYYSPHRSPLRYERYDNNYAQWNQEQRDYRRGRYRGRGRGRFYKNSPPRGHDHQTYNRYRDENYVSTSPKHYRSPSRYYDQRMSPRCDYSRDSREREYRSFDRETDSTARDRNIRRRSHSNSLLRNQFESERERERDKDRNRDRENDYRHRSRRSRSRRYSPLRKLSQEPNERNKAKSPEKRKDWEREKDGRYRSRERRSYEAEKDKRKYSGERDRNKDFDRNGKRHVRSRSRSRDKSRHDKGRSRSKDKRSQKEKRSLSCEKQKNIDSGNKKRRSSSRRRSVSKEERRSHSLENKNNKNEHKKRSESFEKEKEKRSLSRQREETARSASREQNREQSRASSPKIPEKDDDEKKDKKKEKEKKRKKKEKEKETDEERAARKKKKKEKKEEKRRKQEHKSSEFKTKTDENEENEDGTTGPKVTSETGILDNPNFVASFKAVDTEGRNEVINSLKNGSPKPEKDGATVNDMQCHQDYIEKGIAGKNSLVELTEDSNATEKEPIKKLGAMSDEQLEEAEIDTNLEDDNVELQIHASYESLIEEVGDTQKKGILASVPEISKWELDESQVSDLNPKMSSFDNKSPDFPAKVTREVIKRAENAIFKKAVNAIREPVKKIFEKDEKKDRKIIIASEKDKTKDHGRSEQENDKAKRLFLSREKEKFHYGNLEPSKPKSDVKRTINSLQITIPLNNDGGSTEREFSVDDDGIKGKQSLLQRKTKNSSRSPPTVRVSIKERLGSKIEKQGRHPSPHFRNVEKRNRNADQEEVVKHGRKDYQRPAISSTVESIDAKRSSIDEAHFVPNYDESSDEEDNLKCRPSNEKEIKSGGSGEGKKRTRSSSESSGESIKKHKKKKSKSKKKKQKKSKKHMSDSSESSDSEREKKKHKKSKKKKKSKH